MEKSQSIENLAKALSKFQEEVGNVKKDSTNPFFKSKYASLENVINTIREPLGKNGLSFSQIPCGENQLLTILMHISGEYISATMKMTPKDNTPQGQGSAITYARRYAISALLGIATEDDDDGNMASSTTSAKKTQPRAVSSSTEGIKSEISPVYTTQRGVNKLKHSIMNSVNLLNDPTIDLAPEEIKNFVFKKTGLDLVEQNFIEIDERLKVLVTENEK